MSRISFESEGCNTAANPEEILVEDLFTGQWSLLIQRKLFSWATLDATRRFDDLNNLVGSRDVLGEAFHLVRKSTGARTPGIDGVVVADIQKSGADDYLNELAVEIRSGKYKHAPLRVTRIPKGDGTWRSLGIPTVRDRIVQVAAALVLAPVFEPLFCNSSYAYRPGIGPLDAVLEMRSCIANSEGDLHVIETDIADCFGTLDHQVLLEGVDRRVGDKRVLRLVREFITAPLLDGGKKERRQRGIPQGGPFSPLAMNIYLNPVDHFFEEMSDPRIRYFRVADDIRIIVTGQKNAAQDLLEELREQVSCMGLSLAEKKTRVVNVKDGTLFVGFFFQKNSDDCVLAVSDRSRQRLQERVHALVEEYPFAVGVPAFCHALSDVIRGWLGYYNIAANAKVIAEQTFNLAMGAWLAEPKYWSLEEIEELVQGLGCVPRKPVGGPYGSTGTAGRTADPPIEGLDGGAHGQEGTG